jgi:phosphatidylinositol alpha-1,6-mannosyltransferase
MQRDRSRAASDDVRLLLVTNDYPPRAGGIQQYLAQLVRHFPGEVRVVAPRDDRAAGSAPAAVRSPWRFMWPTPAVVRWIANVAADFAPDVVLFGAPHPLALAGPALRRRLRVPYAVINHGAEITVPAAFPGTRQMIAGTLRRADAVFATSAHTSTAVARLLGRTPHVLGAGVDLDVFRPAPRAPSTMDRRLVVGTVGRFVPRKGQRDVVTAVAALRARGRDVELLVVGRGRLESALRRRAATLGVPARFEVDAAWERLPELYREMDVFALPCRSRWLGLEAEGLGMVFLEAAASGLPVVVGKSGGAPETTEHGVSGYVVAGRTQLMDALESLLADPAHAAVMGARGRARMEAEFSWHAVAERLRAGLGSLPPQP